MDNRFRPIASTLAYILSPDKRKVLLVHRTFKDDDENLGKYNGIGGKLERGESMTEGMVREIREETGLTVKEMHLAGTIIWNDFGPKREDWLAFVFVVESFDGTPYESNEEGTLSWEDIDKLETLPMWKGDRLFLPLVFRDNKEPFHIFMRYDGDDPVECRIKS